MNGIVRERYYKAQMGRRSSRICAEKREKERNAFQSDEGDGK